MLSLQSSLFLNEVDIPILQMKKLGVKIDLFRVTELVGGGASSQSRVCMTLEPMLSLLS